MGQDFAAQLESAGPLAAENIAGDKANKCLAQVPLHGGSAVALDPKHTERRHRFR